MYARGKSMLYFFSVLFACSLYGGAIDWASKEQRIIAPVGAESVEFIFKFKNNGKKSIFINSPEASCGCTVSKMSKNVFLPGEDGEVSGIYHAKGQESIGVVNIKIQGYRLDDKESVFAEQLRLEVILSQAIVASPAILIWRKGDFIKSKTVRFAINRSKAMNLKIMKGLGDQFRGELVEVAPKTMYELVVSPVSTEKNITEVFFVEGKDEAGKVFRSYVYLIIR